nr:peptide chain release factor N(5)-glutamine methyltransferase [Desulfobaculum xiamenense]
MRDLVNECRVELERQGVDSPALSAEILAAHALGMRRLDIVVHANRELSAEQVAAVRALVSRRAAGEPVAYILGEKEFYGLDFAVSPAVLVPRPETELIVEEVERLFSPCDAFTFADFGTGSGCLAVTIASLFPKARGIAVDMSAVALAVAAANARRHGVADRLCFVRADFGRAVVADGSLDLIVANPPYVSAAEYAEVSREVADHEPHSALVPAVGEGVLSNGLESVRALAPRAAVALRPGGHLLMEFGWKQGVAVRDILLSPEGGAFSRAEVRTDLAGLDRYVLADTAE